MSEYIYEHKPSGADHMGKPVELPTLVQREEIVRCRDCAYSIHFFHHDDERWQCTEPYQEGDDVKPDAYCWRGKRKECGDGLDAS